jgi:hypothetical protein
MAEADFHLEEHSSPWRGAWRRFDRNRAAVVSVWIVAAIVIASLIGPWLVRLYNGFEYDTLGLDNRLANPTLLHPFGTDTLGRDLLQTAQWAQYLGLRRVLQAHEPAAYTQTLLEEGEFTGVAEASDSANYPDPYDPFGRRVQ